MVKQIKQRFLHNNRGVTMMDLIVTVGIFLILAAIASLNTVDALASYRLNAAARQLYVELQRVRMKAISENRRFRVVFSSEADTYQLQPQNPGSSTYDNTWEPSKFLPQGIDVDGSTTATITFTSRGTADSGGGSARLCNNSGGFVNVCVGGTGRVRTSTPNSCGGSCS